MTAYTIKITYRTGDSFNTYTTEDEVGMQWEDINKAKQALKWITEHYRAYQDANQSYRLRPNKFNVNTVKDKPWFSAGKIENWDWKFSMFVEKDDGSVQQICTFWCGYFERLLEAEIIAVSEQDDEMKVVF